MINSVEQADKGYVPITLTAPELRALGLILLTHSKDRDTAELHITNTNNPTIFSIKLSDELQKIVEATLPKMSFNNETVASLFAKHKKKK